MPEYLRRFHEGLTEPTAFRDGAASRDALARRFLSAVSARDSGAFAALMISRAEFAWLVFPHHIYAVPPYELDPGIFWMQLTAGSAKGLGRTLERLGGRALAFQALDCERDTVQVKGGPVRVWSSCGIRYREGNSLLTRRLFGSIVEREARFKLLSYANDFWLLADVSDVEHILQRPRLPPADHPDRVGDLPPDPGPAHPLPRRGWRQPLESVVLAAQLHLLPPGHQCPKHRHQHHLVGGVAIERLHPAQIVEPAGHQAGFLLELPDRGGDRGLSLVDMPVDGLPGAGRASPRASAETEHLEAVSLAPEHQDIHVGDTSRGHGGERGKGNGRLKADG